MVALDADSMPISVDGARKVRRHLTKARIRWVVVALLLIFATVAGRLVQLGLVVQDNSIEGRARDLITATRPAILDRNGLEMAVDVRVPSLFAEPRRIVDVDEAADALHSVLPDLNIDWLRQRLTGDKGFVWIKRELTPAIEDKIMQLGIRGSTSSPRASASIRAATRPRISWARSISTTRASPASRRPSTTTTWRCCSRSGWRAATSWRR